MVYFIDLQKATSDERMAKTRFYRECGSGFRPWRGARRGFAGKAGGGRAAAGDAVDDNDVNDVVRRLFLAVVALVEHRLCQRRAGT